MDFVLARQALHATLHVSKKETTLSEYQKATQNYPSIYKYYTDEPITKIDAKKYTITNITDDLAYIPQDSVFKNITTYFADQPDIRLIPITNQQSMKHSNNTLLIVSKEFNINPTSIYEEEKKPNNTPIFHKLNYKPTLTPQKSTDVQMHDTSTGDTTNVQVNATKHNNDTEDLNENQLQQLLITNKAIVDKTAENISEYLTTLNDKNETQTLDGIVSEIKNIITPTVTSQQEKTFQILINESVGKFGPELISKYNHDAIKETVKELKILYETLNNVIKKKDEKITK